MQAATQRVRWTPNLFGIAFGWAGLAECWATAHHSGVVPAWPGNVLWAVAALLWAGIGGRYLARVAARRQAGAELRDPVYSPFLALIPILPLMFGLALAGYAPGAGKAVFMTALVATVALGGWLTGEWILSDTRLEQWHPGYFLPTVAAGFLAAQGSAELGYHDLAQLMFGYGLICWFVLGSILLTRLFTASALPAPLVPTIAIQVAPPVVAGGAWFAMNGNRPDAVALGLAGYAVLMVMVQIRLIPLYHTVPFGPGSWAYAFSGVAVVNDAILWLAPGHVHGQRPLSDTLLTVASTGIALLTARTVIAVHRRAFLPRPVNAAATNGATVTGSPITARTAEAGAVGADMPRAAMG